MVRIDHLNRIDPAQQSRHSLHQKFNSKPINQTNEKKQNTCENTQRRDDSHLRHGTLHSSLCLPRSTGRI